MSTEVASKYLAKLPQEWTLYIYNKRDRSKPSKGPFRRICKLRDTADWINLAKILVHEHEGVANFRRGHYALMMGDIEPIWEHKENAQGGALEIMFRERKSQDVLIELATHMIAGELGKVNSRDCQINGMTFEGIDALNYERGIQISIWTNWRSTRTDLPKSFTASARALLQQGKMTYVVHQERANFGAYRRSRR